jgi:hypothetical protein
MIHVPASVRFDKQNRPRLWMGGMLWGIAIIIFVALLTTAYQTALTTSYLSAEKTSNCKLVEKTLGVETYTADWTGSWSSSDNYSSSLTWYVSLLPTRHRDDAAIGMNCA